MSSEYSDELKRKAFHMSSLAFPLLYCFTPRLLMIIILLAVAAATIYVDINRHRSDALKDLVDKFFGHLMRSSERHNPEAFTGASYMMAGFFLTALLLPKGIAISSWLVLIFADTAAAIVGKRIGVPTNHGKSIQGSVAFFISALMIGLLSYTFIPHHASFFALFLAAAAASAIEYYSFQVGMDDNFTIPITFGFVLAIVGWIT